MKTYSLSAETTTRIYKNWIIEAVNKRQAISIFSCKVHKNIDRLRNIKCELVKTT
jgi:hypothetical protein